MYDANYISLPFSERLLVHCSALPNCMLHKTILIKTTFQTPVNRLGCTPHYDLCRDINLSGIRTRPGDVVFKNGVINAEQGECNNYKLSLQNVSSFNSEFYNMGRPHVFRVNTPFPRSIT